MQTYISSAVTSVTAQVEHHAYLQACKRSFCVFTVLAQPASQPPPAAPASQAHISSGASTWNQAQTRAQGNDLDILCNTGDVLPHVDGQEVEEIFLDIEREMSNRALNFLDSDIENNMSNPQEQFPQPSANATSSHGVGYQSSHPVSAYGQATVSQAYNAGTPHFQGVAGGTGYQQGPQNHMDGFSNSVVSSQLGFSQNSAFPRGSEFDLDDLPKGRRRPPSPRVDPLKQQQKWEEDEKLGAMATISPVLYANLEHVNLKQEYPGKAISAEEVNGRVALGSVWAPNHHLDHTKVSISEQNLSFGVAVGASL